MNFAEMSITEIKNQIAQLDDISDELIKALLEDQRKGVVGIARQMQARKLQRIKQQEKWTEMTQFEKTQRQQGKRFIVGIDEVGRGPLAGPVVACAVALPENFYLLGLNDSKKVPETLRNAFYDVIMRDALSVGIGIVSPEKIDEINILEATREAMKIAVQQMNSTPDVCLIDAVRLPDFPYEQLPIIGGDAKSVSIAAASIVAKVTRDRLMVTYSEQYPGYHFDKNAGYGTEEHLDALRRLGPTLIHRRSFGGVKELVAQG